MSCAHSYSIPDPETELGREVSTAEKEGASELRLAKDHPLRLAVNMVATLPAGIRLGLCLAPRMLSLMKDIRIPNMAEQERQQSDTKTFDKDKIPTQIGFANGNLPAASVVMFSQVTFGLVRSVASSLFHHRSLPEPVVLQLLDALDTTISLLQIYPSFPHCVGIVGALADSEMVKTLVEVAVKGEPAASLASLKLLAKLIPDLVKLTHTAISGPEALELGQGSVAEDTFTTIQSTLVPGLEEVVVLACKQEPHHAAEVAANLAIILRASRFEDKLWDVSSAFLRIGRFMSQDADFITRFLIDQDTADPLVRKFPILLPPRVPGSSCNCRANEGNPQRSPVCHICFPYANILESKYGDRPVFGFRVDNGDRRHAVPVFDSGEAANLWLNELVEIGGGTEIGVERSYKDCKDALEKDEGYRAAPGVPRIVREKVQQLFPQHQLLMDELVRDETAMILGRVLGNLKVAVEKPDANGDAR